MIYCITIFMFVGLICTLHIDKYQQELKKKGICAYRRGPVKEGRKFTPSSVYYLPCEGTDNNTNTLNDILNNTQIYLNEL